MANERPQTFEDVRARLDEIVDAVNAEGISLDDALALYEEAVKLGLAACDLSEEEALAGDAAGIEGAASDAPEAADAGLAGDDPAAAASASAPSAPVTTQAPLA